MCIDPGAGCATMSYLPSLYCLLSSIWGALGKGCIVPSAEGNSLCRKRQRAYWLAIKRQERVGERRGDHRGGRLPHPGRLAAGGHDVDLDAGRLVHAQYRVIVEVRLLH